MNTSCFDFYKSCSKAIHDGILIEQVSNKDKEFHFQNWCGNRFQEIGMHYENSGRNKYPDFCLVEYPEGYEIKGLACPGRDKSYDANSNVPSGYHNGREIYYVFGRYPNDTDQYRNGNHCEYPVIDLVVCHGDFMNAQHDYVHKNKHVSGFGSYGDIMIRDRKMYVVPTPFFLTEGTVGLQTLIIPANFQVPDDFFCVGELCRVEGNELVVGYHFDLRTNKIQSETIPNPSAGKAHFFKAYRCKGQSTKSVQMANFINELQEESDE